MSPEATETTGGVSVITCTCAASRRILFTKHTPGYGPPALLRRRGEARIRRSERAAGAPSKGVGVLEGGKKRNANVRPDQHQDFFLPSILKCNSFQLLDGEYGISWGVF